MPLTIEEVQAEYIQRCKACLAPKFYTEYYILAESARSYGQAIKDILGGETWLEVVKKSEAEMPQDIASIGGIPISYLEDETGKYKY